MRVSTMQLSLELAITGLANFCWEGYAIADETGRRRIDGFVGGRSRRLAPGPADEFQANEQEQKSTQDLKAIGHEKFNKAIQQRGERL